MLSVCWPCADRAPHGYQNIVPNFRGDGIAFPSDQGQCAQLLGGFTFFVFNLGRSETGESVNTCAPSVDATKLSRTQCSENLNFAYPVSCCGAAGLHIVNYSSPDYTLVSAVGDLHNTMSLSVSKSNRAPCPRRACHAMGCATHSTGISVAWACDSLAVFAGLAALLA